MLSIENVTKEFHSGKRMRREVVRALDGVTLSVEAGRFFTLLGPSGCGKTTLLRCVAGLETPTEGTIVVNGRTLYSAADHTSVRPNDRGLGMVFQSYAVWPHMTVQQNVIFPLRVGARRGIPRREAQERVRKALALVQLEHLSERRATDLSGGQQQRLALARALVIEPPLLLLDEPLSNLDAKLREEMRFELKRLQRELGITTIYVTHDQSEALAMSNEIAVMDGGKVQQIGTPRAVYGTPASEFVARFIGSSNLVNGTVRSGAAGGEYLLDTECGPLSVRSDADIPAGQEVLVSIRPEQIQLSIDEAEDSVTDGPGVWRGTVENQAFLGEMSDYLVSVASMRIRVKSTQTQAARVGDPVLLRIGGDACALLPGTR